MTTHNATRRRAPRLVRRPPETPLMVLHRVWRTLNAAEHIAFLTEMLTPAERQALLTLSEDEAWCEEAP